MQSTPVLLIILDGWGIRNDPAGNAIIEAQPAFYQYLLQTYPHIALEASGELVGLPAGQMGNSEVGHLNMGAGRIVYQELTRIDKSIREGDFYTNATLLQAIQHAKQHGSTLHLMGLVSDGGVHSSLVHIKALITLAKQQQVEKLCVHAFLDGRDVPPKSAELYLSELEQTLLSHDYPQIATISGRYYAMDRDKRWERTQLAYDNLTQLSGNKSFFSLDALQAAYNNNQTDEFVEPAICDVTFEGVRDNDSVIFFNFRPDRARQLTQAFTHAEFTGFTRAVAPQNLRWTCMCLYDETFPLPVAYPKQTLTRLLAEVLSENGVKQFRTAETEKYAHVTYFFNGGFEAPYPGEARELVASPKVATYDLQPEMSLSGVTQSVLRALDSGEYGFIATNFANPDMVGHTGVLPAAIEAVKAVDKGLETVIERALERGYTVLLTADHGNIETMIDEHGGPHTSHTTDPVPLILMSNNPSLGLNDTGMLQPLSCIAPTILEIMQLPIPKEMTTPSALNHLVVEAV